MELPSASVVLSLSTLRLSSTRGFAEGIACNVVLLVAEHARLPASSLFAADDLLPHGLSDWNKVAARVSHELYTPHTHSLT